MRHEFFNLRGWLATSTAALLCSVAALSAPAQTTAPAPPSTSKLAPAAAKKQPAASMPQQKLFATPKEAGEALAAAAESYDIKAFTEILGLEGLDLVQTQDTAADKQIAKEFAALARQKAVFKASAKDPKVTILHAGPDDWPLPIPLVKFGNHWRFDPAAGRQEVLLRRIGRNELNAIEVCRGYVESQGQYAEADRDGNGVLEYAQRIISSDGKKDGLSWRNADGTYGGPVGERVAKRLEEGHDMKGEPFHGYFFKVLKGQGPNAPLGELDFVIKGYMIGGFALVAWPAQYRVTGVKTFIVSHDGIVYQQDLGPDFTGMVKCMERYNPGEGWTSVDEVSP
ncbi:MAG: DUF2950 domain-containing protein [Acidobacteria bacterium]|nr:DUF2950 domain-containing protein [Acidobacteriota bacterium]